MKITPTSETACTITETENTLQRAFETDYNIWTLRFTFPKSEESRKKCEKQFQLLFDDMDQKKQIKYSMTFSEYSKKHKLHYHSRVVTTYKTPNMLRKYVKSFFPNYKGNKFFSTHKVWIDGILYDKSLCHSSTYIAKEGHIIHHKGYTQSQMKELIA